MGQGRVLFIFMVEDSGACLCDGNDPQRAFGGAGEGILQGQMLKKVLG